MRFFKHLTNASRDERISALKDEFGQEGYGVYWTILEIIAEKIDEKNITFCQFSVKKWRKSLDISAKKLNFFVTFCEKLGLFFAKYESDKLTKNCPKLLKYKDEWTKRKAKKRAKNSGETPDQLLSKNTELEVDTELDTDTDSRNSVNLAQEYISRHNNLSSVKSENLTAPKPKKIYSEEIQLFVKEFIREAKKIHGNLIPDSEQTIEKSCDVIDKLIRKDGYTINQIADIIKYGLSDDFWSIQIRSLANVRSRSKNGCTKFKNLEASMQQDHKNSREYKNAKAIQEWLDEED